MFSSIYGRRECTTSQILIWMKMTSWILESTFAIQFTLLNDY